VALCFLLGACGGDDDTSGSAELLCGNGVIDASETCDAASLEFCNGWCGARLCVDLVCNPDCTCNSIELTGDSCCSFGFREPGCALGECEACVCGIDEFCCDTEWDPSCSALATGACESQCSCG
jgi:hypothetical protein